ncbi:uncharacterized protein LOC131164503 [Malania oleifera]|uniref:uncharacterized protein LOC131164503 n=1 Tax=Malania oleifera TaxID=397392 RepID=UPI0025AE0DC1|nr:uncharacterized protein LOC131164503 [Malania oleifera]
MERSEPILVPEWLKSSGNVSGGGGSTSHQIASSSLQSDEHAVLKPTRSKSSVSSSGHDIGRSISDRTTSTYFRRSSSSNGSSHSRSYSSFGRSHRDREWEDIHDYRDKDKSILGDHRHRDYSDPLGSILPSRFEKDVLRRTQSMISGKRGDVWPKKVTTDSNNSDKANHSNGNGLLSGGGVAGSMHKAAFERDFPSLGAEEKQGASEIGRVPSPGLSTAIQNLPVGSSAVIGGDGWTSALAEVPVIFGNNSTGVLHVQHAVSASSSSITASTTTGLNMAETLAQGPRSRTIPQVSVGTQRLEELAFKQSRQLIPMTPPMPKASVLNPLEKPKAKIGQQQQHQTSLHLANHTARTVPAKSDVLKLSNVGKLHILKPAREKNGVVPIAKDSLSPTNGSKVVSPLAVAPLPAGSGPLRSPGSKPSGTERKLAITPTVEKRPTPQAQSRNDFFNLMRKKSSTSTPSAAPNSSSPVVSSAVMEKPDDFSLEVASASVTSHSMDNALLDTCGEESAENRVDMANDADSHDGPQKFLDNGEKHSISDAICYPEEEEAAFLRSLGWEENAGEDEGLTEEEISAFFKEHMVLRRSSKLLEGMQSKILVQLNSQGGLGNISSGSSPADSDS